MGNTPETGSRSFSWRYIPLFVHLAIRRSIRDRITLQAAALAFVTILSLVPLLAAFSFIATRIFVGDHHGRILQVLTDILPYTEETLLTRIDEFLLQAEQVRRMGAVIFIGMTLTLVGAIESAINQVWAIGRRRTLRARFLSYTMLLFWGPLLIGAFWSSLLYLRQSYPLFKLVSEESFLFQILPIAVSFLGLSMLFWMVPNTTVRFQNAALGAAVATILLEILRRGFSSFTGGFQEYGWVVYGSFALVFLFMLSIQFAWAIILFGVEVSYTAQYFSSLRQGLKSQTGHHSRWIGLAALVLITRRFQAGRPITNSSYLANTLHLTAEELDHILVPLLDVSILKLGSDERQAGYLLSTDPQAITVAKALSAYDRGTDEMLEAGLDNSLAQRLINLKEEVEASRTRTADSTSLAGLTKEASEEISTRSK